MAPLDSKNLALLLQVKTAKIGVLGALNGHLALAGSNRDHFLQAGFLVVIRPACQNSVWPASCLPTTRPEGDQRELLWLRNSFLVSFFPCTPSSANVPGSATTRSTQTPRRSHPRPRTTSRDSDSETWRRSIHHQFRHDACRGGSAARLWMRGRLLSKFAKVPLK